MNQDEAVGGQALIEGVMMRCKTHYTLALRKESGEIKVIQKDVNSLRSKLPFLGAPFLRGVIALIENLTIGTKSLIISANEALPEDEKLDKSKKAEGIGIFFMLLTSLIVGMGVFVAIPNILTEIIGIKETANPILFNLISGFVRLSIFIGYIIGISYMEDVKRVFQYHGAEHKAVNTYEAGQELTMENTKRFTTYHTRCGTSFLFFVFFISIFVFSVVPVVLKEFITDFLSWHIVYQKMILIPSHIVLMPLVASISYEVLKMSSRKMNSPLFKIISRPGYYIQKLTTKEPSDDQVEVALVALKETVRIMESVAEAETNGYPQSVLAKESA